MPIYAELTNRRQAATIDRALAAYGASYEGTTNGLAKWNVADVADVMPILTRLRKTLSIDFLI